MWVRKSETEIHQIVAQQEADKRNLVRPFLSAAAITVVVMLLYLFGLRGRAQGFIDRPAVLNWQLIVAGIFVFALFAVVATYRQRKHGRILVGAPDILRCRDCKELEHVTPNKICSPCGGPQEPSGFFRWVDEHYSGKP